MTEVAPPTEESGRLYPEVEDCSVAVERMSVVEGQASSSNNNINNNSATPNNLGDVLSLRCIPGDQSIWSSIKLLRAEQMIHRNKIKELKLRSKELKHQLKEERKRKKCCSNNEDRSESEEKLDGKIIYSENPSEPSVSRIVCLPKQVLNKTWKVKNCGVSAWPAGSKLVLVRRSHNLVPDEEFSFTSTVPEGAVAPAEEVGVTISFPVPEEEGRYMWIFRLMTPEGQRFGPRFLLLVFVSEDPNFIPTTKEEWKEMKIARKKSEKEHESEKKSWKKDCKKEKKLCKKEHKKEKMMMMMKHGRHGHHHGHGHPHGHHHGHPHGHHHVHPHHEQPHGPHGMNAVHCMKKKELKKMYKKMHKQELQQQEQGVTMVLEKQA